MHPVPGAPVHKCGAGDPQWEGGHRRGAIFGRPCTCRMFPQTAHGTEDTNYHITMTASKVPVSMKMIRGRIFAYKPTAVGVIRYGTDCTL